MKIRNFFVENREIFMDCLENELCKNGISYIKIDNEIHFLDQIIRLYDFKIDREIIIRIGFSNLEKESFVSEINDSIFCIPQNFSFIELKPKAEQNITISKNYQSRNRYIQKQEANSVKQKLKRYSK